MMLSYFNWSEFPHASSRSRSSTVVKARGSHLSMAGSRLSGRSSKETSSTILGNSARSGNTFLKLPAPHQGRLSLDWELP